MRFQILDNDFATIDKDWFPTLCIATFGVAGHSDIEWGIEIPSLERGDGSPDACFVQTCSRAFAQFFVPGKDTYDKDWRSGFPPCFGEDAGDGGFEAFAGA